MSPGEDSASSGPQQEGSYENDILWQLWQSLTAKQRRHAGRILLLAALSAVAEMATLASVVPLIAALQRVGAGSDHEASLAYTDYPSILLSAFAAIVLVAAFIRILAFRQMTRWSFGVSADLLIRIQSNVILQDYSYHVRQSSSELLASLDRAQIAYTILLNIMQTVALGFVAAGIYAALLYASPVITLLGTASLLTLYGVAVLLARNPLISASRESGSAYARRIQLLQEGLGGIRDIIISRTHSFFTSEYERIERRFADARARVTYVSQAPRIVIEGGLLLFVGSAALLAAREGSGLSSSLPVLAAVGVGAARLLPILHQAYHSWALVRGNQAAMRDLLALLRLPCRAAEVSEPASKSALGTAISFSGVGFQYPNRSEPALADITFELGPKTRLALVGPSGSGKSTLLDILMGLIEPTEGVVTVGTEPLTGQLRSAWQAKIAHVSQRVFIANSTIRENVGFGIISGEIDEDRLFLALKNALLLDFVTSLPNGWDTSVGEDGMFLSGGQRQRLGIARALYQSRPILILDEALNSVDTDNASRLIKALDHSDLEILVIISHDPLHTSQMNDVIELRGGRVSHSSR
jgi:ATP-binding cassette, subfamily B, bacterial PglK